MDKEPNDLNSNYQSPFTRRPHPGCSDGWRGSGVGCKGLRLFGWWNVAPGPCGGKAVPSSPPCLCGTSSLDPLHIVIRGRPLRASVSSWQANSGTRGEWCSLGHQENKQQQQHVFHSSRSGWDGSRANEWHWVHQALPVRLFFSSFYPLCVVPSSALLFALAGCYREGPLRWCLCNLLGNF